MRDERENGGGTPPAEPVELRLFRVKAGQTVIFRSLNPFMGGLLTHWEGRRSRYCHPEHCYPKCRAKPAYWKGYLGGQIWMDKGELWYPVVLEVTEQGGLDIGETIARGTVWEMTRAVSTKGNKSPVRAKFLEYQDAKAWPPPFDVSPTLLHVYHLSEIRLDIPNPLPPRPMAMVSVEPKKAAAEAPQPSTKEAFRDLLSRNGMADMLTGEEEEDGPESN